MFEKLLIALIFSSVSCTRETRNIFVEVGHKKVELPLSQTLRVNIESEPVTLDWNLSTDFGFIADNIMEGLLKFDLKVRCSTHVPIDVGG